VIACIMVKYVCFPDGTQNARLKSFVSFLLFGEVSASYLGQKTDDLD
jgi:hypothetical protein